MKWYLAIGYILLVGCSTRKKLARSKPHPADTLYQALRVDSVSIFLLYMPGGISGITKLFLADVMILAEMWQQGDGMILDCGRSRKKLNIALRKIMAILMSALL